MQKNIIFDWSGVVKDCFESFHWIINKMFQELGAKKISIEELKENWKQPYMSFYNKYIPNLSYKRQREAYSNAILSKDCPESKSFNGIVDLIKKLKNNNYYLAVVSSDLPDTFLKEVEEYDLENIFNDVILDAHNKTEAVKNLIIKNNLNLGNTFFIGDSNHEIEVSKETGIKSIAVTWGYCSEKNLKLESPDFIVHDTKELEKIIL